MYIDRLKKSKNLQTIISFLRIPYYILYVFFCRKLNYKVLSPLETVRQLQNGKSLTRFGDGEINIMVKKKSIGFQMYSKSLEEALKNVLLYTNNNYEIGIPRGFNNTKAYNFYVKTFWWSYLCRNSKKISKLFNRNKIYLDTNFSRVITEVKDKKYVNLIIKETKKIWDGKNVILIEGDRTRFGVGNGLLVNAKSIKRIIAPNENAFRAVDDIYRFVINKVKKDGCTLILVSLGPTATILCSKLSQYYQCIDIGHFDLQYEYFKRGKYSRVNVPYKYDNEMLHGNKVKNINASDYNTQIIYKIV